MPDDARPRVGVDTSDWNSPEDAGYDNCHCGAPVHTYDDGFTRNMCEECSSLRCDITPGPCPVKNGVTHEHLGRTHEHAHGALPHTHMLRAICQRDECRGFPTHDVHPLPINAIMEDGFIKSVVRDTPQPHPQCPTPICSMCHPNLPCIGPACGICDPAPAPAPEPKTSPRLSRIVKALESIPVAERPWNDKLAPLLLPFVEDEVATATAALRQDIAAAIVASCAHEDERLGAFNADTCPFCARHARTALGAQQEAT